MSNTKQPVTISLPSNLVLRLDTVADAEGDSRSALIRRAVIRMLKETEGDASRKQAA